MIDAAFATAVRDATKQNMWDLDQDKKFYETIREKFSAVVEAGRTGKDSHIFASGRTLEKDFYDSMLQYSIARRITPVYGYLRGDNHQPSLRNRTTYEPHGLMQRLYSWSTSSEPHPEGINGKIKVDNNVSNFLFNFTSGARREKRMLENLYNLKYVM